MSLLANMVTVLNSDPTLSALVSDRITPVIIPQNQTMPCIRYTVVGERDLNTRINNNTDFRNLRVQFDCYSPVFSVTQQVAKALSNALLSYQGSYFKSIYIDSQQDFDSDNEPNLHKQILEFYIQGED